MANVMFKRGLHANLFNGHTTTPKITPLDGTFYLTTDTNRLYVANGNSLVELNKSIHMVDTVGLLPTTGVEIGQFYYVKGTNLHQENNSANGNILAVVTGFDNNNLAIWVQVNPDTDTKDNDHLGSVSVNKGSLTNGVIPYTLTFQMVDRDGNNLTGTQPSVTINIDPNDIISLIDADVATSATGNTATITTKIKNLNDNSSSTGSSFVIEGGSNVTVTKDATSGNIKISTGIGSDSVQLKVTSTTNQVNSNIKVNGENSGDTLALTGDRGITVVTTSNTSGTTTTYTSAIGHSNTATAQVSDTSTYANAGLLTNGGSFNAIIASNYDTYGHITSQTSATIQLPTILPGAIGVDSTDKNKLTLTLTDQDNNATTASVSTTGIIFNTITVYDAFGGTATSTTVNNQGDIGTFYSKTAIDNMMKGLDALTYKGTVSSSSGLPDGVDHTADSTPGIDERVKIGDTYKVAGSDNITVQGQVAKPGDLIIATGTEGADGYITGTPTWTVVASGAETDTHYDLKIADISSNSAKIGIIADTANGSFTQYFNLSGDGVVTVTGVAGTNTGSIALGHKTSGVTTGTYGTNTSGTANAGSSISIPAIGVDAYGHITSITATSITLPGNNKFTTDTSNKAVKLQTAGGDDLGKITFSNGTLTSAVVTGSGTSATVTFNHTAPTMGTTTATTAAVNITSATATDRQIVAVSSITKDDYGHVTALDTKTITFNQVNDKLKLTATTGTNTVTINTQLTDIDGTATGKGNSQVVISSTSGSISITPTVNTANNSTSINLEIVWGTFDP